jgi:L,D-transpeptidase catalytic domain
LRLFRKINLVVFIALSGFILIRLMSAVDLPGADRSKYLIVVDRASFKLELREREEGVLGRLRDQLREDERLRLVRTYPIAVGAAGYDTPSGLRHVVYKESNPPWQAPNRPWAGDLAGQTIPYGDPNNPIKSRFIGLGQGIGIHGTAENWSIGGRASHGCIRMRVPDVEALYEEVPVGTPVLIR